MNTIIEFRNAAGEVTYADLIREANVTEDVRSLKVGESYPRPKDGLSYEIIEIVDDHDDHFIVVRDEPVAKVD